MKNLVLAHVLSWMAACPAQQSAAQQASRNEEARQEFARIKGDCQSIIAHPALRRIRLKVQLNAEIPLGGLLVGWPAVSC
jgi:dGTP triphosphohydrolase